MSLLLPEIGLLFWMLLSFGVVFFIVARWGFPMITRMVEERKEYIDKSLEAADEAHRRLAEVKVQSEALLEETRAQQLLMMRETIKSKEQVLVDAKEIAQRETQKMIEGAQKQIRLEREAAFTEIHNQVIVLAVDIAEKVLRNELKEKDHHIGLINRLLDEARREKLDN